MKRVTLAIVVFTTILTLHGSAVAATVTLVKKENAGGGIGNFLYTYSYICNNGKKTGKLQITSANNNESKSLAELEANEKCGD